MSAHKLICVLAYFFIGFGVRAQVLFEDVAGGVGRRGVSLLLNDTIADRLLMAGSFAYINNDQTPVSPGILEWNDEAFSSIGCGVAWYCEDGISMLGLTNIARTVAVWNGEIFLGGDFFFERDGVAINFIMRWDGTEWLPVGTDGMDGPVYSLRVFDDELYAAGWFTYADTVLANGLARWDGEAWHRVVDVPPFYIGDGPNQLTDVVRFQDTWYIGGNLPLVHDLAKWNGTAWESVDGGFTSAYSRINRMDVHNDKLYLVGPFANCPPLGNGTDHGNGIVSWDGTQWDDLGGGTCGSQNGAVADLHWWGDTLFAVGLFDRMGGVAGDGIAKWDGTRWCMLTPPNYWQGNLVTVESYHDSLYIGGGFSEAGPYPMHRFAKWVGGAHTAACGIPNGVEDEGLGAATFSVQPNPATDQLRISGPLQDLRSVMILDITGRVVARPMINTGTVDIAGLAASTYVLLMTGPNDQLLGSIRFVKQD